MCINDTSRIKIGIGSSWGTLSYVELSNNCLDPAPQFRLRDNGAMLNLKRQGCLIALYKAGSGYWLDMFYNNVDAVSLDRSACAHKPDENIYRALTQTSWGGLSVYYGRNTKSSFQTRCAVPKTHQPLATNEGIDPYIGLTSNCNDAEDERFHFAMHNKMRLFFHVF